MFCNTVMSPPPTLSHNTDVVKRYCIMYILYLATSQWFENQHLNCKIPLANSKVWAQFQRPAYAQKKLSSKQFCLPEWDAKAPCRRMALIVFLLICPVKRHNMLDLPCCLQRCYLKLARKRITAKEQTSSRFSLSSDFLLLFAQQKCLTSQNIKMCLSVMWRVPLLKFAAKVSSNCFMYMKKTKFTF